MTELVIWSQYISFIEKISNTKINNIPLISSFDIGIGFSFWTSSSIYEKNPWKTSNIYTILKIIAFTNFIKDKGYTSISIHTNDKKLKKVFEPITKEIQKRNILKDSIFTNFLKHFFSGFLYFFRYIKFNFFFLKNQNSLKWHDEDDSIFICSFFDNFNNFLETKSFYSNYWGGLHDLLNKRDIKQNWLHLFIPHSKTINPNEGRKKIDFLNENSINKDFHNFIDSNLSIKIIFKAVIQWLKLIFIVIKTRGISNIFILPSNDINLWDYYRDDYFSSFIGKHAVKNLLIFGCIDKSIKELPFQSKGLYLSEEQPWERSLIYAWNKYNHGELISVPHSPNLRFWDIFNFYEKETFYQNKNDIPMPNKVALNNKEIIFEFSKFFPKERIIEVEALRYVWLNKLSLKSMQLDTKKLKKVLILGDYLYEPTNKLLNAYNDIQLKDQNITFSFKPHPNQPMQDIYPQLPREYGLMNDIILDYDVFFCGNMTYASVDGYLAGLDVVVLQDSRSLNISPLNKDQAKFVFNGSELNEYLEILNKEKKVETQKLSIGRKDLLFLDEDLHRWQSFLEN